MLKLHSRPTCTVGAFILLSVVDHKTASLKHSRPTCTVSTNCRHRYEIICYTEVADIKVNLPPTSYRNL